MAYTDREDLNYCGQLFTLGKTRTPFLNRMLGISENSDVNNFDLSSSISSGSVRVVNNPYFSVAQTTDISAPSQDTVTEAESVSPTATTITRSEDTNVIEVHQKLAQVTYMKEGSWGLRSGINTNEPYNPPSEIDFQVEANMKQMAVNIDYSFIKGTYQAPSDATTAGQTRGLENAISTNATSAGSVVLSKDLIDSTLALMIASGAPMENIVAIGNAFQVKKLNDIYGYAVQSVNEGGTTISVINTPYGKLMVMLDPNVTTSTLLFVEMMVCKPVILPYKGQLMVVEDKFQSGASIGKHLFIQVGLDYGAEEYHGKITGLTTS